MKLGTSTVIALFAAASIGYAAKSLQPAEKPSKDEMIAAMEQLSAPSKEHEVLAAMAGEFASSGKASFGPGMDMAWKGTEHAKMILGGRFLEVDFKADTGEKPAINGKTIYGFDTRSKKYTVWGIDTLGTYSVSAEGDYDAGTKTLTLEGTNKEQGQEIKFKYVIAGDEKSRKLQIWFDIPGAGWQKIVDTTSTRK